MPMRNPFRKAGAVPGLETVNDENSRPGSRQTPDGGFERASLASTRSTTSILSIRSSREETNEYKLSGELLAGGVVTMWEADAGDPPSQVALSS